MTMSDASNYDNSIGFEKLRDNFIIKNKNKYSIPKKQEELLRDAVDTYGVISVEHSINSIETALKTNITINDFDAEIAKNLGTLIIIFSDNPKMKKSMKENLVFRTVLEQLYEDAFNAEKTDVDIVHLKDTIERLHNSNMNIKELTKEYKLYSEVIKTQMKTTIF